MSVTVRPAIAASWRRVAASGVDRDGGPVVRPLSEGELARRRTTSPLAAVVPRLNATLAAAVDAGQLVVVADADGRVLWRAGQTGVRRLADGLGFVPGSAWTEGNVGTNAIGTALVLGEPVRILGAEHFVESHGRWGCAAAPILDPATGATIGVVDVSGPARGLHPAELALVELAARLVALELRAEQSARLDQLRAHAAPILARVGGEALAVDLQGRTAAAIGLAAPERVVLPGDLAGGPVWLPSLGAATAEPLPGGWLLRLDTDSGTATRLELDLAGTARVTVVGESGSWSQALSPRHAEILLALVQAGPEGVTAAGLADELFADRTRTVTVRAELSRLRRALGSLLLAQPYRLAPGVQARVVLPEDLRALLPGSSAPVVSRLRTP
jgi:hypothetical protein